MWKGSTSHSKPETLRYAELVNMEATKWTVAVAGASGRLGNVICDVIDGLQSFAVTAKLGSGSGPDAGADADLFVDVTTPDVSYELVQRAIERGQKVLVGTSGWSEGRLESLAQTVAARADAGVIVVPNFSIGSVLGTLLAQIAAPHFPAVEIIETHHPAKIDSPSGTAVRTAELITAARDGTAPEAPFAEQEARGEVVAGIPVHSLRLAGVVAKQEVRFGGTGETLTITHDTQSSESYRAGIRAALEALPAQQGLTVGLDQVLGIRA